MANNPLHGGPIPIEPWKAGQPLAHERLNAMQDGVVRDVVVKGEGVKCVRSGSTVSVLVQRQRIPGPEVRLVKVVEANVATGPVVQLVKEVNPTSGSTEGSRLMPVVSLTKMATDDEFYVFRPGSIKGQPTYDPGGGGLANLVRWRDLRQAGVYLVSLTASGGTANSVPMDRTYNIKLYGGATTISAAAQSPAYRPTAGRLDDAAMGEAYIDDDGVPTLLQAYESPAAGDCETE